MKTLVKFAAIIVFLGGLSITMFAQERNVPKATEKNNTFIVEVDFHCGGGKTRLEKGLGELEGVNKVEADLKTKKVTVVHNSEVIKTEDIVLAIEKIGHRTEYTPDDVKIRHACTHKH